LRRGFASHTAAIHFGTADWICRGSVELLGHRIAALNFLGFYAAGVEIGAPIWLSVDKHGAAIVRYTNMARAG